MWFGSIHMLVASKAFFYRTGQIKQFEGMTVQLVWLLFFIADLAAH
jgi:hypothetical protein